ncbi:MAG: glycosyltransferase family 4 protein [Candidatus Peribacteraceae bacterium]
MKTILLISPYWKEKHRWMVSSVKLAELWQRLGYRVVALCMGEGSAEGGTGQAISDNPPSLKLRRAGRRAGSRGESCERISDTLEIHRVPDFFLPDPWNYGIAFGFSGKASKLARELKPDLIVVNKILFWSSFALLSLRLHGYRVILTTDALVGITWWPRSRFAKICAAIYAWTLGWLILKAANRIVFFHPQPLPLLHRLGIAEKSIVIPTGIDLAPFPLTPVPSPDGRGERGVRDVTTTYIGRLESVKGADDFVAAALKVKRDHRELRVQVVGWYKSDHPLVKAHGSEVSFTGLRDDVANILAATDIFVLPSYSEGLSNALMEAMASGCACIASDVGGNAFLIRSGVSGFLFPPGDCEALAAHIRRLLEDPAKRRSLGEAARKRIEEQFSWESVGQQYKRVFEQWTES